MNEAISIIPSLNPDLVSSCINSIIDSGLIDLFSSFKILSIYNGKDDNVESKKLSKMAFYVGAKDSDRITSIISNVMNVNPILIFGERSFYRSYGGSSNLLLAMCVIFKKEIIIKIDEDCIFNSGIINKQFKDKYLSLVSKKIIYGPLNGEPTNQLNKLPFNLASKLARFIYPENQIEDRIRFYNGQCKSDNVIRNTNLLFSYKTACSSCYPVLYDQNNKEIHCRGEVYYWLNSLKKRGLGIHYTKCLTATHMSKKRRDLNSWLKSIALTFDLSVYTRNFISTGSFLTIKERQEKRDVFCDWIDSADWPQEIDKQAIMQILLNDSFRFCEEVRQRNKKRRKAWNDLIRRQNDAKKQIIKATPKLSEFLIS